MRKAFTLIELLIVVSIIGILAVVLIPNFNNAPSRARDAQRVSSISDITAAVQAFYIDNDRYPRGIYCLGPLDSSVPAMNFDDPEGASSNPWEMMSFSDLDGDGEPDPTDKDEFVSDYLGGVYPESKSILNQALYCDDGDSSYPIYISTSSNEFSVGVMLENQANSNRTLIDTSGITDPGDGSDWGGDPDELPSLYFYMYPDNG